MLYYNLNKEISTEKLIQDIRNIINTGTNNDLSNYCLVVSLQKINDYAGDSPVPKITYSEE